MRAAYSTNVSKEKLIDFILSLNACGFKLCCDEYEEEPFFKLNTEGKDFLIGIVSGTIYVNNLGSGMGQALDKAGISFSYTQHDQAMDEIESYFILEKEACELP